MTVKLITLIVKPKKCQLSLHNMWPDLRKGVFHTHPLSWLWRTITWCSYKLQTWNFHHVLHYVSSLHCKNFKTIAVITLKLQIAEVGIFNVCWRPLFANPVTYTVNLIIFLVCITNTRLWKPFGLYYRLFKCLNNLCYTKNQWLDLQFSKIFLIFF